MVTIAYGVRFALCLFTVPAPQQSLPPCRFSISSAERVTAMVVGRDNLTRRVRLFEQPDSPVEIVAIEHQNTPLRDSGGSFAAPDGEWVVKIRNRSDRAVESANVVVHFGTWSPERGQYETYASVGSSFILPPPPPPGSTITSNTTTGLLPGGTTDIQRVPHAKGGTRRTTGSSDAEVYVLFEVEEVRFTDCIYKPATSWPVPR
jgi:hypothetical protein